jgi:hypothetical protein
MRMSLPGLTRQSIFLTSCFIIKRHGYAGQARA